MSPTISFAAEQHSLQSHTSYKHYPPTSSHLASLDLPFPSAIRTVSQPAAMEVLPRRFSCSIYETASSLPAGQLPLPDAFPPTLPSQMPTWTHPFDPTIQITPQMWLPVTSYGHALPSPMHHQQSPYDMTFSMTSPLSQTRSERSQSLQTSSSATSLSISTGLPSPEQSPRESYHIPESPGHADLNMYGWINPDGTWKCAYPGCTSRAVFTRGCDLRKHHKRHTKSFFCRYPGCTQSSGGGFSSKKDLARHEAKHNPGVVCEWAGCDRIFSRVDNMRDHVKRIHLKANRGAITKNRQRSI